MKTEAMYPSGKHSRPAILVREVPIHLKNLSRMGCLVEGPSVVAPTTRGELRVRFNGTEYCDRLQVVRSMDSGGGGWTSRLASVFEWGNRPGACSLRSVVDALDADVDDTQAGVPELGRKELVLWRVQDRQHHLECAVSCDGHTLRLTIRDRKSGSVVINEPHSDIVRLVDRADRMRRTCLAEGYADVQGEHSA